MTHPYSDLPTKAFWRPAVAEASPFALEDLYTPKWRLEPGTKIATAGSCFAQHITSHLKAERFNVLDLERPPCSLPQEEHQRFGFSLYSCRYGNIYTAQQLLQLAQEVRGRFRPAAIAWERDGRFYDALRPGVEPEGLGSAEEVMEHRKYHLSRVKLMFKRMDVFIFTLGLTEAWVRVAGMHRTVYPTAPGTIAGHFTPQDFQVDLYRCADVVNAIEQFRHVVTALRRGRPFRLLLTVSPVPLTATASGQHVLTATTHSKAVLRAAAGDLAASCDSIDYFPSYEIITNPAARGLFYAANLRSVLPEGVAVAMETFTRAHRKGATEAAGITELQRGRSVARLRRQRQSAARQHPGRTKTDVQCEESLLDAFGE